jgi:hypothetical protein
LHVIISYTCLVLYVLTLALFPVYCSPDQKKGSTLMKTSSRRVKSPVIYLWQDDAFSTA